MQDDKHNIQQSQEEQSQKESSGSKRKQNIIIAVVIAVFVLAIAAFFLVQNLHKSGKPVREENILSSLHTFPPIDFNDSLYAKKVLAENEDGTPKVIYFYKKDKVGQPTNEKVHERYLYPGNKKYIDGNIANENRDGLWYAYFKDGTVQTMAHYVNGKENGQYTVYHGNGKVYYTGKFALGKRVGKWTFYDEQERLTKTVDFDEVNNRNINLK